jgi:hypothetical protein
VRRGQIAENQSRDRPGFRILKRFIGPVPLAVPVAVWAAAVRPPDNTVARVGDREGDTPCMPLPAVAEPDFITFPQLVERV